MKIENRNVLLKSKVASQERTRNLDSKKKILDVHLIQTCSLKLPAISG